MGCFNHLHRSNEKIIKSTLKELRQQIISDLAPDAQKSSQCTSLT